jgi:HlyD family secretion protein
MKLSQRTFIIFAGSALVLLIALVVAFAPRLAAPESDAGDLQVARVQRGTLVATVSATGPVSPPREAALAFGAAGPLTRLEVKPGDRVKTGQLLAQLDTRTLELQVTEAAANLAAAEAKLNQLRRPSPAEIAAARANVASAEAAVAQLKTPSENDLLMAKSDLEKAAAAVSRAQADYDRIGGASNPLIAMSPQALALQQATLDYQKAVAAYNAKVRPTDSQLKQAQASLEQARAQLAKLTQPSDDDIRAAQASVDQAKAARDLAQAHLDDAILRAPFDGIVTHVDLDLGSFVPAGRVIVGVADASALQVKLNIDETDIAQVHAGQGVTIDLDAYPDVSLPARVTDVASTATVTQGVVNYVVTVTLDPGQIPVKLGMTANANIEVARKDNVLLVPNQAIRASNSKRYVTVQNGNGQTQDLEVKLGLANDQQTEVVSGLSEGQQVLISTIQVNPAFSPFGGSRR